jgi:hypothetical protein
MAFFFFFFFFLALKTVNDNKRFRNQSSHACSLLSTNLLSAHNDKCNNFIDFHQLGDEARE